MLNKLSQNKLIIKPDAILFDTDNTLYEYEPANAIAELAVEAKIKNQLGIKAKLFRTTYNEAKQEIKSRIGKTASSHSRLLYFQRVLEILGFKAQLMTALDLEQTFWRTFLANAPLFPYVYEFLEFLKLNNIKIAIVTDLTSHIQLRKLSYFNLENIFDAVVTSEEVGADKPDRRNFDLVLNKLKLTSENSIWMVGDNPEADIYGGKLINATTFQKIHRGVKVGENECRPDYTFNHFNELKTIVAQIIYNK